jgi:chorismate synthase
VVFLSGLFKGKTTGAPIAFLIPNRDTKPDDYENIRNVYRPSHADYTWHAKYGIRDHRGGGRASARETAARVVGGAIAKLLLNRCKIDVIAYTAGIGNIQINEYQLQINNQMRDSSPVGCPDSKLSVRMAEEIKSALNEGDSIGCSVHCIIRNLPAGLGEPVFDKLDAQLAKALFSIPAVKAVEIGSGTDCSKMRASAHNDAFVIQDGKVRTLTNHSGGIQGGISNSEDVLIHVHFKPPASITLKQSTVDTSGKEKEISVAGRHDPCLVPRALVVVEAMAALIVVDYWMINGIGKS